MKATNLIQLARTKKRDRLLGFLKLVFNDFAYPVYLFGSYATGKFHGHSDVDIVIIAPDAEAKNVYRQACKQLAELGMNYDILIASSINTLNSSIVASLKILSAIAPPQLASPPAPMHSNSPIQPHYQANTSPSPRQRGLTLVELMIAMLLGLFLVGGLLQLFISSKQTYRMQEAISRLQENGRFAIDFMTRDIRLAGYKGCASRAYVPMTVLNQSPGTSYTASTTDFTYNFNIAIQGFEAISTSAWSPAMIPDITLPLGGSDVITIRRADEQGFFLVANQANNNADLTLDSTATTRNNLKEAGFFTTATTPVNKCAIAVVADCVDAVVFQVSAITSENALAHNTGQCSIGAIPPGNQRQDLGKAYKTDAQVRLMNTISYFVRTTNGQSSLFSRIGTNDAQELVEGVESMQILYGVDTEPDESANYYVAANAVPDWNKVVSVRISLLLATIDNNLTDQPATSFSFNAVYDTPSDRKIRRVFTSTIAVRNHRLPS